MKDPNIYGRTRSLKKIERSPYVSTPLEIYDILQMTYSDQIQWSNIDNQFDLLIHEIITFIDKANSSHLLKEFFILPELNLSELYVSLISNVHHISLDEFKSFFRLAKDLIELDFGTVYYYRERLISIIPQIISFTNLLDDIYLNIPDHNLSQEIRILKIYLLIRIGLLHKTLYGYSVKLEEIS